MEIIRRIDRKTRKRALIAFAVFAVLGLLVIGRLFYLQVVKYDYYQSKVVDELMYETEISPSRGEIYDSQGNLLATNITTYLVFISPQDIIDGMKTRVENGTVIEQQFYDWTSLDGSVTKSALPVDELVAHGMNDILGADFDKTIEQTKKVGSKYAVVRRGVDADTADLVREFIKEYSLTSEIYLRPTVTRYYPYGSLACHAIGFTNSDGVGIYGIESYYNNIMEGTSGRYVKAQDALNNDMPSDYESFIPAENGYNIITTIDTYIQYELERQVRAAYDDSDAGNRVTGIVMNPNTGAILAMATYPNYDLNDPYSLGDELKVKLDGLDPESDEYSKAFYEQLYMQWNNKAVNDTYEPGSTFKIITTAMALEDEVVDIDDPFRCTGELQLDSWPKPIHCHKAGGHGDVTFAVGLQQSCNPVLMQVGMAVGQKRFYEYFQYFGYGAKTGIDIPGESSTIYSSYNDFSVLSLAVYSFGQTFRTTPIQQLSAISAVANGGYVVTPHIMSKITDDDGNTIFEYGTDVKRQVVSTATCKTILNILEEGVSGNGAAKNAYVKGYKVAAKTGTSEKRDKVNEAGETPYRIGSCVAIAPSDDPQITAIIIVDEPMAGAVYGSVVAAPYVANLLSSILPYLGVEPQYTDAELALAEVTVSNYVGASVEAAINDLNYRGLEYEVIGNGDTVTAQSPAQGSSVIRASGKVIIYTGSEQPKNSVYVPNVIGFSGDAANKMIVGQGLNISIAGATNGSTATVISQFPAAGTPVTPGTLVSITLRHLDVSDE